jgi:hypothetical protein
MLGKPDLEHSEVRRIVADSNSPESIARSLFLLDDNASSDQCLFAKCILWRKTRRHHPNIGL